MRHQPRYKEGDKIGGRYLVHQAMMGGMGEVYLCYDIEINNYPIALKTFQERHPQLEEAFRKEVFNWIALERHPNVVYCQWMQVFNGRPFAGMEWVENERGASLRSWLERDALNIPQALLFTIDIVRGLIHANTKVHGIVHRDLKPENVLVDHSGQAKVNDFGLALVAQHVASGHREVAGTPLYMAPEQWRGETQLDFRTDIYAVGCILYELLTREPIFKGDLARQHLTAPPPRLSSNFPSAIQSILDGCLAKHPIDRFKQLETLFDALKQVHESHSGHVVPDVKAEELTAIGYTNRGMTYAYLGQYEQALADYDTAIQLDPDFPSAYNNRASTYGDLGRHEEALVDCNKAIQLNPNIALFYWNRGRHYASQGNHAQAIADYAHGLHLDPNMDIADAHFNYGNSCQALGQHEQAIRHYDNAIRLDSHHAEAYNNRGNAYSSLGRTQQALASYDIAVRLAPDDAEAHYNRGTCYRTLGQHKQAIADFDAVIQLNATLAPAYYNRAISYGSLGQEQQALVDFDAAIRMSPDYADAHLTKGAFLATLGRLQEALPCFESAYRLGHPGATEPIHHIRRTLGMPPMQIAPDDPNAAFDAFMEADSLDMMRITAQRFPILEAMISDIEQAIMRQVPPDHRPRFGKKLSWLRQVTKEG